MKRGSHVAKRAGAVAPDRGGDRRHRAVRFEEASRGRPRPGQVDAHPEVRGQGDEDRRRQGHHRECRADVHADPGARGHHPQ
ncbi:hypothetical protein SBRY_30467 [Actinacidiphila bryophytorum]|uniref:Uncharacterized protein n=1 Tax=Actinacidiphila bryophytorum TaxID=1436133 RepID=A0A9W4H125_9ACTN|nr:hypothetical protein SBRY_30467 [Actinacidiphila bryophytorum]